jgi:lipopolysaccharide transport protein LptA
MKRILHSILNKVLKYCLLLVITVLSFFGSQAQVVQDTSTVSDTTSIPLIVINADHTYMTNKGAQSLMRGNVILRQDSIIIYADTVNLLSGQNSATASGNIIIQKNDTISAFSNELDYAGNEQIANMRGDVVLQNGSQKLYSEDLVFNLALNSAHYNNNAVLTDGEKYISSKKGTYLIDQSLVIFHDSVIVAGKEFSLRTDSLHFLSDTSIVRFIGPTRIIQKESNIYCESGYFDLATNNAILTGDAQFVSSKRRATADTIIYRSSDGEIVLIGNAWLKEEDRLVDANRINYFANEKRAEFIGDVYFRDSLRTARGEHITYYTETDNFVSEGRASIIQEGQVLQADFIRKTESGKGMLASGSVEWIDTVQDVSLYCDEALLSDDRSEIKAYGHELLFVSMVGGDSLHLTADTLHFLKDSLAGGTNQIRAYRNVVAYKSDLQFVADSVHFDEVDSLFRILGSPIIWSDTTQFTGDTIFLQMANDEIDKVFINQNAMILNSIDEIFFNQMKGKQITADFVDKKIQTVHVKGNAQSVYYAVDVNRAYIGVNDIECSEIKMVFKENQVEHIKFYKQPTSKFYPMTQVDHEEIKLEGTKWDMTYRCSAPQDIFRIYHLRKEK